MSSPPPALVLLHGFLGHADSWQTLRTRWPEKLHVLCPCLPGHDPRQPFREGDDFTRIAARMAAELACEAPFVLAGYSMGARVALAIALDHPQLISQLVLIGVNPGLASAVARLERQRTEEEWIRTIDRCSLATFCELFGALPVFATQRALPAAARATQERIRRSHDPRGIIEAIRRLGLGAMPDYTPRLGSLKMPVDLIVGEHDTKFRALAEEMLVRLACGRLSVVPSAGHNPLLERPAELAAQLEETLR